MSFNRADPHVSELKIVEIRAPRAENLGYNLRMATRHEPNHHVLTLAQNLDARERDPMNHFEIDSKEIPCTLGFTDEIVLDWRDRYVESVRSVIASGKASGYSTMLDVEFVERCDLALAGDLLARNRVAQIVTAEDGGIDWDHPLADERKKLYALKLAAFVERELK